MRKALEHSPTKEKLLDAAKRLMLERGFSATTIDEICETAGATKGSFFHYFENKEHLVASALEHYWASLQKTVLEAPFRRESDPLKRLYGFLDYAGSIHKIPTLEKGCLIGDLIQELYASHPNIRKQGNQYLSEWGDILELDLKAAKEKYAPDTKIDTRGLADHIIAVLQGSMILFKASENKDVVAANMKHLKEYLKNVFHG